ncbi:MAG TPA: hypothetical protein VGE34_03030 [Candidatus Saccharimonadales bacterium]
MKYSVSSSRFFERGSHHLALVVVAVVALVGLLGFVGYNAWQRQQANAGGKASLGQLQTQLKNAEANLAKAKKQEAAKLAAFNTKKKNEKKEDPEIAKLYTQLNKATKAASGLPSIEVLNQRVAERQAEVARMQGQVAEAVANLNAAKAARDAASKKNKPAKQAIVDDWKQKKENREAKLADAQKDLGKAQEKQKLVQAVADLKSKIESQRQLWGQWKALENARKKVAELQKKVADLKTQVAAAKNDNKKPAPKPENKPGTPVRASCPKDKPVRGFAKGVCYAKYTAWAKDGNNACEGRSLGNRATIICKVKRTYYYEISSSSGVGLKTERKQTVKSIDFTKPTPTCKVSFGLSNVTFDPLGDITGKNLVACR